jgi:hypothetical protein
MFIGGVMCECVCVCVCGGGGGGAELRADDSCEPRCGISRMKYRQSIYVIRAAPLLINYEEYKLPVITSS